MMKKYLSIIIFIISLLNIDIVFAINDTTLPTLDTTSITVSTNIATVGDNIKISLKATDDSGILNSVYLYYQLPLTNNTKDIRLKYNNQTELYEGTITVDETFQYGIWKIKYISITDSINHLYVYNIDANNNCNYNSPDKYCTNLSNGNFTIEGTNPDITGPIIDPLSLNISTNTATVGDIIKVSLSVTDNKTVKYVNIYYIQPITETTKNISLSYNASTDKFEYEFTIDDSVQAGKWEIKYILASDGENYTSLYNTRTSNYCSNNCYDLINGNFTIEGTSPDVEAPSINIPSLTISTDKAVIGDIVTYSITVTDNKEINYVALVLKDSNGNNKYTYPKYDSGSNKYVYNFEITEDTMYGLWKVYYISAEDTSGNYSSVYNNHYSNYGNITYHYDNITFFNYENYPNSEYVSDSLSITKNMYTTNDTGIISLAANNPFGVKEVNIIYTNPVTKEEYPINLEKENDIFSYNLSFNEYGYNGLWIIKRIEIISEKSIKTIIDNGEIDLNAGNFTTYDLIDDFTNPVINSFSIINNTLNYNDTSSIIVNTTDDKSGIKKVIINYTLPNNTNDNYELTLKDSNYIYDILYNNYNMSGMYIANYIKVIDNANNTTYNYSVSNLNFNLKNDFIIISPALYLNKTTSYYLKAVDTSNGNIIDNVTWTSSNTNIAGINSKTGALSTKNIDGKVTIRATLNDNSEKYAEIELYVSNTAIQVGSTTSFGNTNYIGYSEVEWIIDDESIIASTGQTGYIAINNNYKHSITVKGLKPGKTTLRMLTPSGEELMSGTITVYENVSEINSQIKSITALKNESIDLNITTNSDDKTLNLNNLIFISENNDIATVDAFGHVKTISAGETNIVVYTKSSDTKLVIPVKVNVPIEEIIVKEKDVYLYPFMIYKIEYDLFPIDTTDKNVLFNNSNEEIIIVSDNGEVEALTYGDSTVIITLGNIQENINFHVVNNIIGDMNYDAKVTLSDVIKLLKKYLGVEEITQEDIRLGDMNNDGIIGLQDIITLLRIYLGIN